MRLTALSLKQIVRQEQNRFLIKEQAYASLIEEVKERVYRETGIELQEEVRLWQ